MPIVKLNTDFITNHLQCPEGNRRIEYCDKSLPGFLVEVTNASPGIGSYRLRYKDDTGATRYVSLGRTNVVNLDDARKKAKKLKAEIELGADPRAEDKARKSVPTLDAFLRNEYFPFSSLRIKTTFKKEAIYRLHMQLLGRLKLDKIRRHHIIDLHSQLKTAGLSASTCNK